MKYLSVCSGIEAATVAWHPLGWEPVGFSEIEPFPSAVLAHHYPHVPNFGDMTKFQEWPLNAGAIDLLVAGTPCQSFSVAGLRQGLKDPRGNLMLTYLAIAARLRPRWVVWENVPGVLSSNGGRDFGSLLGGLRELGYGFAYRVLDAQWVRSNRHNHAVPQRRRRVFVVGCLGDATAAAKVLFERESVQRHIKKSGTAREEIAADVEGRARAGCWWDGGNTSDTLTKCGANGAQRMPDKDNFGAVLQPIAQVIPLDLRNSQRDPEKNNANNRQGFGVGNVGDPALTVDASFVHGVAQAIDTLQQQGYDANHASTQETNAVETLRVLRKEIGEEAFTAWGLGILDSFQPSQILRARLHGEGIRCATFSRSWAVYCAISREKNRAAGALQSVQEAEGNGCSPSGRELPQQLAEQLGTYLSQLSCPGPQAERFMHHLWCASEGIGFMRQALSAFQEERRPVHVEGQTPTAMTVRRLTPTECEFLQGFPRNYTLIPWRKKAAGDCPDGPRYKALGNSMAVNCMEWIGERIAAVEAGEDA